LDAWPTRWDLAFSGNPPLYLATIFPLSLSPSLSSKRLSGN